MKSSTVKFAVRLLWSKISGKSYPFLVQFSITNRCNCRCNYCYAAYFQRPSLDMKLTEVQNIIDRLASRGTFRLNLVGGEPLLRKDVDDIVDYAHKKGLLCAMTTNGILVPEKMETVKKFDLVCFSLDGQKKGNDRNRGEGSFAKTIAGLQACKDAGVAVQLSAVLTKHTVNDVEYLIHLAEQYECRVGFTTLINPKKKTIDPEQGFFPEKIEVQKALATIVSLSKMGKPVLFTPKSYEYALSWPDHTRDLIRGEIPSFPHIPCLAGKYFCIIDYNGDIYPCPQLVDLIQPGNIMRDGLDAALQKATQHNCRACSMPCSNDFSLFFAMKATTLINYFINYRKSL